MKRFWPFLVFPILGSLTALLFRPSERDPYTFEAMHTPRVQRKTLHLASGESLLFLGVPAPDGGVAFSLSITELSSQASGGISYEEALRLCERYSAESGRTLRLPRLAEWQMAARGGIPNAETAWGYGLHSLPPDLNFALNAPPTRPGPPLGYGFRDLAGGRWEWTEEGVLVGGAWSEQNPDVLRIDHTWTPPEGYADADTGLRILLEPEADL